MFKFDNFFDFYINNWIFGSLSIKKVVKSIARIGFKGIELVGEPKYYNSKEIRKIIENYGMRIISICGKFPSTKQNRALCHPNHLMRQKAIDYVKTCIEFALEVGARSVLIVPETIGRGEYFVSKDEDLKRAIESISKITTLTTPTNILLTIEPLNHHLACLVCNLDDAIKMAKEVNHPNIRVVADTFHMQNEEPDGVDSAIRRGGAYWIQHIHFADSSREVPGLGTLDWRKIFRSLLDINYKGYISLEPVPKYLKYNDDVNNEILQKFESSLRFSLRYLREVCEIVIQDALN